VLFSSYFAATIDQCGKVFHPNVMTMRLTVVAVQEKQRYDLLAVCFRAQVDDDKALRRRIVAQHVDCNGGILSFELWYIIGRWWKMEAVDVRTMFIR